MRISVDGRPLEVAAGVSLAAALIASRADGFAPLCGMGVCQQCRVMVDGVAHTASCQVECREGMEVRT